MTWLGAFRPNTPKTQNAKGWRLTALKGNGELKTVRREAVEDSFLVRNNMGKRQITYQDGWPLNINSNPRPPKNKNNEEINYLNVIIQFKQWHFCYGYHTLVLWLKPEVGSAPSYVKRRPHLNTFLKVLVTDFYLLGCDAVQFGR